MIPQLIERFGDAARTGYAMGQRIRTDPNAFFDLRAVFGVLAILIGAVLTFIVAGRLFVPFQEAVQNVTEPLGSASFGEDVTDSIAPVFAIVVGLAALAGVVMLLLKPFGGNGS
jgi:hypothetical protein